MLTKIRIHYLYIIIFRYNTNDQFLFSCAAITVVILWEIIIANPKKFRAHKQKYKINLLAKVN